LPSFSLSKHIKDLFPAHRSQQKSALAIWKKLVTINALVLTRPSNLEVIILPRSRLVVTHLL
jgi:hypothetical protein